MKKGDIEKYTNEYDLFKVPDSIIIQELRKEIKRLNIIIGGNESYILELEDRRIEKVKIEVEECSKCAKYLIELKSLKASKTLENLINWRKKKNHIDEQDRYKELYYKEVEENKRLNKLLLQGLKNSIK